MFRSKKHRSRSSPAPSATGLFAWAGNLAIFYLILLALITIPFLVPFMILSIRAALDYQSSNNDRRLLEGPILDQLKALPMDTHADEPAEVVVVEAENPSRVRPVSIAMELERLSGLFDRGVLTEAEFQELKERLLKTKEP